jgi:hypothetical protein
LLYAGYRHYLPAKSARRAPSRSPDSTAIGNQALMSSFRGLIQRTPQALPCQQRAHQCGFTPLRFAHLGA